MPLACRPLAEQVLCRHPVMTVLQPDVDFGVQEPLAGPASAHPVMQPRRQRHRELVAVLIDVPEPEAELGLPTIIHVNTELVDPLQQRVFRQFKTHFVFQRPGQRLGGILRALTGVLNVLSYLLGDVMGPKR